MPKATGRGLLTRGEAQRLNPFFYPALLYPVTAEMRIYGEEQFGPVIPVVPYDDISETVNYVVNSNYGQQASIFGRDADQLAQFG